ncbi:hypothetical protein [Magnetococcus sp. PR-3]|uniref:hypothetical protein n=1 Tax=Magnetococcus sp. PR-3 TaxID=3120355 RepID=UPI002FCDF5ED
MKDEMYIEGIGEIGFHLGMIRMNLMGLDLSEKDENGNPTPVVQQQAVMSLRGFLVSLAAMENMVDKLVDAGVLKRRDQDGGAVLTPAVPEAPDVVTSPGEK